MKKLLFIPLCLLFVGCASYSFSHMHGVVNGNSITTPYGPVNGNAQVDMYSCVGTCPAINMAEVVNCSK